MNVNAGLIWPPDNGIVTMRNKKEIMKTASGTSFGSTACESKHEIMVVRVNTIKAVTNSVEAAFHI